MIRRKKYKVYPPLLSNTGNNTDNIWLSGPLELNDNDDVLIIEPQDGDGLVYNSGTNQWENTTISKVKHWLTESHQIGQDFVTTPYYYYGGSTEGFSGHANWNTSNWDASLIDVSYFNWSMGRGALRPIPFDNVTKIYFNGHIGVPPNDHYTSISIHYSPCVTAVNSSPFVNQPICLGTFSTTVNSQRGVPYTGVECMNFEIDLMETLGYSLGTSDMILVAVQSVNITNPGLARSIALGSPMMINFNLSLETTDSSLEFNTAGAC